MCVKEPFHEGSFALKAFLKYLCILNDTMLNALFFFRLLLWLSFSSPLLASNSNNQTGNATYYHSRFWGVKTTSGERYHPYKFTAAHKTFPLHSLVEVYFPKTHKKTIVRINDRGPFRRGAIIDLSLAAAKEIGLIRFGVSTLEIKLISDTDSVKKYRNELEAKDALAEKVHVRKINKKKHPKNKIKRKSKSNLKIKPKHKSDLKKKSKSDSKIKSKHKSDPKKKSNSELKIKSKHKSDLKKKSKSELKIKFKQKLDPKKKSKSDSKIKSKQKSDPKKKSKSELKIKSKQ